MLNPQPKDAELAAIYSADYFLGDDTPACRARLAEMKAATARHYLSQLRRYRGPETGRLLEIGSGQGDFLLEAQRVGYDVFGIEISSSATMLANQRLGATRVTAGILENAELEYGSFDICVLSDVIEHTRNPMRFLTRIRRLLKPGGTLFIATPSLDSWSARLLRQNWMEFKPEHLLYFDRKTIQTLLHRAGFDQVIVQPGWKILNLEYIAQHFERFPVPFFTNLLRTITRFTPKRLRETNMPVLASGIAVYCRATTLPERRRLSVVLPAYNEGSTFESLMQLLLKKQLPDLDIEIIIVESGSTDGTHEIAAQFQGHPRVKVIFEDKPRGKGHAVRTGFQYATGDFILIQDADLEYDLEDYDALLEPLIHGREAFVLGSRHGGKAWKMRRFANDRLLSLGLNAGHWFFTSLVNILFFQRLRDPFTMFKVFRRDCLAGLHFECNRFDFDYELLIKLVRKGYTPIEIPVNYRSRSFKEGKKVSMWRDPWTWLAALIRLRLTRIDTMKQIERQRFQQRQAAAKPNAPASRIPVKLDEKP
jgi:glycosyltransferase involved in cell wall biosynthesis/SAM-dependent methyltransferase